VVGGHQLLFGGEYVGTMSQHVGGQLVRNPWNAQCVESRAAGNRVRRTAEQNAEGILLLGDRQFGGRHELQSSVVFRLRLMQLEHRGVADIRLPARDLQ
jgi:hypothetical protein